jgi:protein required for attachment to host cells
VQDETMEKTVSWIVVADGGHAKIFANEGPGKGLQPVSGEDFDANLAHAARDIVTDRPGRTFDSVGAGRHAKEPPSDPRRLEKEAFLGRVADHLGVCAEEGRFHRLVLVAEPRALGALRGQLSASLGKKVHAELAKDLTKATTEEIAAHVGEVLAV